MTHMPRIAARTARPSTNLRRSRGEEQSNATTWCQACCATQIRDAVRLSPTNEARRAGGNWPGVAETPWGRDAGVAQPATTEQRPFPTSFVLRLGVGCHLSCLHMGSCRSLIRVTRCTGTLSALGVGNRAHPWRPLRCVVETGVARGALQEAGGDRLSAQWARRASEREAVVAHRDASRVARGGRLGGQRTYQQSVPNVAMVGPCDSDDAGEYAHRDLIWRTKTVPLVA